ncbi:3-isopropylmalate dehydratase small subunit [Caballeronia sp. LP003]|nr:3-isopropylmalate dehydratase small subunit [Caballeronia sp. LP003]MDR5785493.1 3-isopropylmalate dehydratase small subunit [Caballeronia sp. LP003]
MKLQPFETVTGAAPYLSRVNIDTDVIIRIEHLTALEKDQLGPYAMEALRFRAEGSEDPCCVLNQAVFRNAPILVAGQNFGCGSSREAAVWALQCMGVRCVIAPSFGEIFFNNCFQNGVLPIRLPAAEVEAIGGACASGEPMTVDLRAQTLRIPRGRSVTFSVDAVRREGLLRGLDDIGLTLQHDDSVRHWQDKDRIARPWAWPEHEDASREAPPVRPVVRVVPIA